MNFKLVFVMAAGLALASAGAAQNTDTRKTQDLPSAPSATKLPPPTAPATQPPPPQPAPAAPAPEPSPAATKTAPPPNLPAPSTQSKAKADPPTPKDDDQAITVIRHNVDEVNLVFTVTDKRGRFVKDLKQNDFKVLDDKKPPMQIKDFRSETDLPLRVGLLIDASNSIRERFKFEQEAATEFLNDIVRRRYDRAFVIGFDSTPEVTQDFTDSGEMLSKGIHMLRAGGGTALYDAVYFACRDKLLKAGDSGAAVRKAIILLSDGEDNQSRVTREEAIEMAQRAEVIIYAISTNISGVVQRGDKTLQRIAEATGGRYFAPFKLQDVANAFSEIEQELRSQYAMAYKPADFRPDGRFREIDISADRKGLQVRARKGYFAPRQ